ncbi:MAG: LytTR family DNA-binding domain-containing protein [Acidobacteriota bacterium]
MPIRTLIIDDEPLARDRIRALLADQQDIICVGECADGRSAVAAINEHSPDLIFLDVQMPEMDGFGVLQALPPERMPAVIFVTAYDRYAVKAFEVHALDYLLKPFDRDRFQSTLDRARSELKGSRGADATERLLSFLDTVAAGQKYLTRFVIKSTGRIFFLKACDVDWIEPAGNYLTLHVGKESHLVRGTMNAIETRLDPKKFFRIHRSAIVNIEAIRELQPWFHGEYVVVLRNGTQLTLSRGYREKLQELLGDSI